MNPRERIIIPLDVDSLNAAEELVTQLTPYVGLFKTGLELLTAEGTPQVIACMQSAGASVFADVKFKDIPTTIGRAANALSRNVGVRMFNVYADGGVKMMQAAVANKRDCLVLAVTVLTSMDENECIRSYGYGTTPLTKTIEFAYMALEAGVDGIICSPLELEPLKSKPELSGLIYVTPGVRPSWAAANDQKRVMTPAEAIRAGADYLVIGRPVTQPPAEIGSPVEAAKRIIDEIAVAFGL